MRPLESRTINFKSGAEKDRKLTLERRNDYFAKNNYKEIFLDAIKFTLI